MNFSVNDYITLFAFALIYSIVILIVYLILKAKIKTNTNSIDLLRKDHELLKQEVHKIVDEIRDILKADREEKLYNDEQIFAQIIKIFKEEKKENKESHAMIAQGLGSVAINVAEMKEEVKKLIK